MSHWKILGSVKYKIIMNDYGQETEEQHSWETQLHSDREPSEMQCKAAITKDFHNRTTFQTTRVEMELLAVTVLGVEEI